MSKRGPIEVGRVSDEVLEDALSEHPAPAELVVARGMFAAPNAQVPDELYARIVKGSARRRRDTLTLDKGAVVTTSTYFGVLPASYFQRWTNVTSVRLTLAYEASGGARISLCASDFHGNNRTLDSVEVDGTGTAAFTAHLDAFVDGGSLWMEAAAIGGSLTIADLTWTAPGPEAIRPAALIICTFDRPQACTATVRAIADDDTVLDGIDAVYVIDQGSDPVLNQPAFGEVAAELGDKCVYLQQPNLGGSGGFSRGLFEVSRITDHANVILMDDDITCEPETVLRINAFANLAATPSIVGAQMLFQKNPRFLLASAEMADLATLRPGRWAVHGLHYADMVTERQTRRVDGTYTGWWTCLIPAEFIAAAGLPLPYFIKWDDIEYSLRALAAGFPVVTLPNAAVWHADFHWKDGDDWVRYFDIRNSLITAALRDQVNVKVAAKTLRWEIATYLVSMQYGRAHTVIQAIEDFLEGPSVLDDGGAAAMTRIRELRSKYFETVVHPAVRTAELTGSTNPAMKPTDHRRKRLAQLMAKRLLSHFTGRLHPGPVTITAADASWWHVSRFNYAVITDASQTGVRIRRHDKQALISLTRHALRTLRRFRAQAPAAQERYRAASSQLASRENWRRLFQVDDPQKPGEE
jgi:galactofuranosylgalactofuranosylrhamnosyl-N-acetylglucosaminyl-diphospho-decaprenol beta-1,5/1,6-galactofuranosyltransferase